jgi:hypothetical protein
VAILGLGPLHERQHDHARAALPVGPWMKRERPHVIELSAGAISRGGRRRCLTWFVGARSKRGGGPHLESAAAGSSAARFMPPRRAVRRPSAADD